MFAIREGGINRGFPVNANPHPAMAAQSPTLIAKRIGRSTECSPNARAATRATISIRVLQLAKLKEVRLILVRTRDRLAVLRYLIHPSINPAGVPMKPSALINSQVVIRPPCVLQVRINEVPEVLPRAAA